MKIQLCDIEHNPSRNMKRNPIDKQAVADLVDSFQRNKVWPNVVVRPHPKKQGKYQLAYGHHRLAAMKKLKLTESEFIVQDIDDWGMYTAMVDENESGRNMTSALVYENIEQGIKFLEPVIRKCKTVEEFEVTVPRGTVTTRPQDYTKVRNNVLEGKGLGRGFLEHILPGNKSKHPNNINAVLKAHYADQRAEAEKLKADAARKKAEAEKDEAKAAKLNEEADAHDREAEKHSGAVKKEILVAFPSPKAMREFSEAVSVLKIPKNKHQQAAAAMIDEGVAANQYRRELTKWWDVESGALAKRLSKAKRESDIRKMARKFGGADINTVTSKFLRSVLSDWKDLYTVKDHVQYLNETTSEALHSKLSGMYDEIGLLLDALEDKPEDIEPVTLGEIKKLTAN